MDKMKRFVLLVNNDEDACFLVKDAFEKLDVDARLAYLDDEDALLGYLKSLDPHTDKNRLPYPDLILLDLNMPAFGSPEAIKAIKSDPRLNSIPIVILAPSHAEKAALDCYVGANAFIVKPPTFEGLLEVIKSLELFWLHSITLSN